MQPVLTVLARIDAAEYRYLEICVMTRYNKLIVQAVAICRATELIVREGEF